MAQLTQTPSTEGLDAGRVPQVPSTAEDAEWFVSPRGAPEGPFTTATVEAMWTRGEVSDRTYCWKPGFEAWKRLALVPELRPPADSALDALLSVSTEAPTPSPVPGEPTGLALFGAVRPTRAASAKASALGRRPQASPLVRWLAILGALALGFEFWHLGGSRPHAAMPVPRPAPVAAVAPPAPEPAPAPFVPLAPTLTHAAPPRFNRAEASRHPAKAHPQRSPPRGIAVGQPHSAAPSTTPSPTPEQTEALAASPAATEASPVAATASSAPTSVATTAVAPAPAAARPPEVAAAAPAAVPSRPADERIATPAAAEPEILKSLWQPGVLKGVLAHRVAIQSCVDHQHAEKPEETGVLVMQWSVTAAGTTQGVHPKRVEAGSTPFAECLAKEISSWTFRLSGPGSDEPVQYPFRY